MTKFTQTYQTDLKYSEWEQIEQYFPPCKRGRRRKWEMWLIVNAIFYVTRTGCQWRMMPKDLPSWQTVYGYFGRWKHNGVYELINATLVKQARQQAGRNRQPSAASIDSQSVKTSEGGEARGVDVHKQTNGRKRHIVVDTLGFLLLVAVHSAGLQDAEGGKLTLQALFNRGCCPAKPEQRITTAIEESGKRAIPPGSTHGRSGRLPSRACKMACGRVAWPIGKVVDNHGAAA